MAVLDSMTFYQAAAVLNEIHAQATGQKTIAPVDTASFVSQATTALKTGYDPIANAINQVLSRTIFSVRPYSSKFKGLEVSETSWGNHVRKLSIADKDMEQDQRYLWPVGVDDAPAQDPGSPVIGDGYSVDMYKINKPEILQTNFYGSSVVSKKISYFRDQLECAFRGPDEFARFVSMYTQNAVDMLEQYRENTKRACVANLIGGVLAENNGDRVVHLLTEYNALTGLSLTSQTVYQPDNFKPFMQWVYSRVAAISSLMTERSQLFQTVVNGKKIMRHTPQRDQKVYMFAPAQFQIEAQVLADTYHDTYLKTADVETVNFWQDIKNPDAIDNTASRITSDGSVASSDIDQGNIFGVIFDREAAGFATIQQWSMPTPFNADGGYYNQYWHETHKVWNDHTEKVVVLLLD